MGASADPTNAIRPPPPAAQEGGGPAGALRVRGGLRRPPAPASRPRLPDPGPGSRADGRGRATHLAPPSAPARKAHHRSLTNFPWLPASVTTSSGRYDKQHLRGTGPCPVVSAG